MRFGSRLRSTSPVIGEILKTEYEDSFEYIGADLPLDARGMPTLLFKWEKSFDCILLPLSLRNFYALQIAEIIHVNKLKLKTILMTASPVSDVGNSTPFFDFYLPQNASFLQIRELRGELENCPAPQRLSADRIEFWVRDFLRREGCFSIVTDPGHGKKRPSTFEEYQASWHRADTKPSREKNPDQIAVPVHKVIYGTNIESVNHSPIALAGRDATQSGMTINEGSDAPLILTQIQKMIGEMHNPSVELLFSQLVKEHHAPEKDKSRMQSYVDALVALAPDLSKLISKLPF
jgi:hypothetical protein